ncbi:MAG: prephenate dehydrogenase/arogenate dehydrogenase family protein, partial [Actinobacteria bacterium]|nr:prephenate dehydrogenase/arogenate dehydrogenase family protein [Actinomycetota bacterium]
VVAVAGPGLRDMTRLASSDPALWTDILLANRHDVARHLGVLAADLDAFAGALADGDAKAVTRLLRAGRAARRRLLRGTDPGTPANESRGKSAG